MRFSIENRIFLHLSFIFRTCSEGFCGAAGERFTLGVGAVEDAGRQVVGCLGVCHS